MTVERIPIMQLGSFLLASIQVELHDRLAIQFADDLTARVVDTHARGVLIDISTVDLVDSFMGRMLSDLAAALGVLDAATVIVGMQPAVAITLVELGLSLAGLRTAMDVEQGMAMLSAVSGGDRHPGLR
jgi:rsbT antagonist protein RsbS